MNLAETDRDDLIRRLAIIIDVCMDHLDAKAAAERKAEAGKAMRQVTHQRRAEAARKLLAEAEAIAAEKGRTLALEARLASCR